MNKKVQPKPVDTTGNQPGVHLVFRSTAHYARWLDDEGFSRALGILRSVISTAGPERFTALAAQLQEACGEEFNEALAVQAMRKFFNDKEP